MHINFKIGKYIEALKNEFDAENIPVIVSYGTMQSLDPTKDASAELKKLVGNTLSVLIS